MAKNLESGHAKNVANFKSLITVSTGFGAVYNPSKQSITLNSLTPLLESASNAMNEVNSALSIYTIAIAARKVAFNPLNKLATRIKNFLKGSDTTQQIDDAVKTLVNKIQGQRATPKLTDAEKAELKAKGETKEEISSSQMGFDNRLDSFDKLIKLLSGIPQYTPNQAELQIATLANYYNNLNTLNSDAVTARFQLKKARMSRNDILYKPDTGLIDTANAAKNYIRSLFGAISPEIKQLSGLTFKAMPAKKVSNEVFITDQVPVV